MENIGIFNILDHVPDPENLIQLEPPELAGYILEYLKTLPDGERIQQLNLNRFSSPFYNKQHCPPQYQNLPPEQEERIIEVLMEAWSWLEHEGIFARKPGANKGQFFITKQGGRLQNAADLEAHRKANLLPKDLLHPLIAQKVWPSFLRGEYDTAVFQAFKEVEIAVRKAGAYTPTDYGVSLMRKAFDVSSGPLTDQSNPDKGERQALSDLFAGAIGSYKNPHSHRHVSINTEEAVEMIILASHLFRIVESRSGKP